MQQALFLAVALHAELQLTHPDLDTIANFGIVGQDFVNRLILVLTRSLIKHYLSLKRFQGGNQPAALMLATDQLIPFATPSRFAHLPGQNR
jgi:hypothetical protein